MKGNAGNHPAKFCRLVGSEGSITTTATRHSNTAEAQTHILTWAENPRQISSTICLLFAVPFDSEAL